MNNLFFNNKEKLYYFNDNNKPCDYCNNTINRVIFIICYWDKSGSSINYFCFNCRDRKSKLHASVIEEYKCVITTKINKDCIPVFIIKPLLANTSNFSNFDVANTNLDGEQVEDHTEYSGRESFEGMINDNNEYINRLEFEDQKVLETSEGLELIESLGSAQPLIEYNEKKLLE